MELLTLFLALLDTVVGDVVLAFLADLDDVGNFVTGVDLVGGDVTGALEGDDVTGALEGDEVVGAAVP